MQALQPTEVLCTLEAAGLVLSLTSDQGLRVTPASCLTDKLRAIIRVCKRLQFLRLRQLLLTLSRWRMLLLAPLVQAVLASPKSV